MMEAPSPIQIAPGQDGALVYFVDLPPEELPPVRRKDLSTAWEQARDAAHLAAWGAARTFHFRGRDGEWAKLALQDPDAQCWAGAVDREIGLQTGYGLSVCMRLLALVDLLGRSDWAASLVCLDRRVAEVHPALLRLAAEAKLTDEAGFDGPGLLAELRAMPGSPLFAGAAKP